MLPRELIGNGQEQKWGEALLQCREKQMNSIYILELRSKDLSGKKKKKTRLGTVPGVGLREGRNQGQS